MHNKLLIIISSPSGGGKSTMCKKLIEDTSSPIFGKSQFSVSATTRTARKAEVEGKDYFFLSKADFKNKIKQNEFLEYADVFGNFYGTLKSQISTAKHTLFDIDVQGHAQIKAQTDALSIFLLPPSIDILKQRLRQRGDLTKQDEEKRINEAINEIKYTHDYDYILINSEIEKTFNAICGIISSNLLKKSGKNFAEVENFEILLQSL